MCYYRLKLQMKKYIIILFSVLLVSIILFILISKKSKNNDSSQSCSLDKCGAIDPVNEPDYNMRNIIKQSILLEEHIAEENKYCISCIIKHFLHIIGLAEEATWMAGSKINNYPHLQESVNFYTSVFNQWKNNKFNDDNKRNVLDKLRKMRRELIDSYF